MIWNVTTPDGTLLGIVNEPDLLAAERAARIRYGVTRGLTGLLTDRTVEVRPVESEFAKMRRRRVG